MSEQTRPPDSYPTWRHYWTKVYNQPWRTEPEIEEARQRFLAERRAVTPDVERGVYPFKDIALSRGDVEWLLATLESGGARGPVEWTEEKDKDVAQRREGLDVRGADMRLVNLNGLPLARLRGGVAFEGWIGETDKQGIAPVHLDGTQLGGAHLEGANLGGAHLTGALLTGAHLERAHLVEAHLEGADLTEAHLGRTNLRNAHLEGKLFSPDELAQFPKAGMPKELPAADIRRASFESGSTLDGMKLGDERFGYVLLADVRWSDVNLAVVDWTQTRHGFLGIRQRIEAIELGDERVARSPTNRDGMPKNADEAIADYQEAVRANRQLATMLRGQGLNEDADRFAYKAQKLQRQVLLRQGRWGGALGSWLLDTIAGYGYRPARAFIAYVAVIALFTGLYLLNSHFVAPHLTWDEALVLSMSSFHGRGFFSASIQLGDTYARLAAVEALVGLFIEITFIATFTQRFFAR